MSSADTFPDQWGKPLQGEKCELRRYRVGDYQPICHIRNERITCWSLRSDTGKMRIGDPCG